MSWRRFEMIWRKLFLFIIVLSPSLSLAQTQDFKVSGILGLTGPAQVWAKYARMGAEMAIQEVNESGGLKGRKVTLVLENSASTSAGAVSAFRKAIAIDKPDVIFGDVWTQLVEPLIPLSTTARTVLITPTVVASTVTPGPYAFTMGQKPETASRAVSKFFDLHPGLKSVSIFCWDNPWGSAYLELWKTEIERRKLQIVSENCVNDFAYDYRTDVAKVLAKKPDAVIITHQAERILKLLAEQNFRPVILSTSNIIEVLHDGTLSAELAEGVFLTNWNPSVEFQGKFQKLFGEQPILEAHNSYESLRSVFRAYQSNPQSIKDGIGLLHYDGVAGPIDFRGTFAGNNAEASLDQIRSGKVQHIP